MTVYPETKNAVHAHPAVHIPATATEPETQRTNVSVAESLSLAAPVARPLSITRRRRFGLMNI